MVNILKKIINEYTILQEKFKKRERISLRSDTMFNYMLCNSERKKFLDYFLVDKYKHFNSDISSVRNTNFVLVNFLN